MPPNSRAAHRSSRGDPPRALPAVHRAGILAVHKTIWHGFTGGFSAADQYTQAAALWRGLKHELGRNVPPPVLMAQPHGTAIAEVGDPAPEERTTGAWVVPGVDGVECDTRTAALLVVKSADCVPILAVDSDLGRCAALHAGWRGVAAGILPALLERWRRLGSSLHNARLALGPHIRACCFEVRQDCVQQFSPADLAGALATRNGSRYIALEEVLRTQAARFDITSGQIEALGYCTDCARGPDGAPLFASYRRAGRTGAPVGRNLSFIAMIPQPPSRS